MDVNAEAPTRSFAAGASPALSILVLTSGPEQLREHLDSVLDQALDPSTFEVVVVVHVDARAVGPVREVLSRARGLRTRLVTAAVSGVGPGLAVGASAARGDHVTVLRDGDRLPPGSLGAMLATAAPDVVVVLPAPARTAVPDGGRDLVAALLEADTLVVATAVARAARPGLACVPAGAGATGAWAAVLVHADLSVRTAARPGSAGTDGAQEPAAVPDYDTVVVPALAALAGLGGWAGGGPVEPRRTSLRDRLADAVNTHLAEHPDDHRRVVDDVATLGASEFPWTRVNAGLARDLAICYCFPPDLDTSALVAAKRLRARGEVTDVVSHDLSSEGVVDPGSLRLAEEVLGRTHVVRGEVAVARWSTVLAFATEAWMTLQDWEESGATYRRVYSRAMLPQAHFAGALVKARRPELEWVAEFSDPLRINSRGQERVGDVAEDWLSDELAEAARAAGHDVGDGRLLFEWAELLPYALADRIVFTNDSQLEVMMGYCRDPRLVARVRAIAEVQTHPELPRRFYHLVDAPLTKAEGVVHLAYFGVFYPTRDLGDVLQAILRLRHSERARLVFDVYTPNPDALELTVVRLGLSGVVRPHAYVPVLEFLNLSTKYDVLVVNDGDSEGRFPTNPYLPAKVADYRGSGTAVWAIHEPGSVMSRLEFAHASPLGDIDAALSVLQRLLAGSGPVHTSC